MEQLVGSARMRAAEANVFGESGRLLIPHGRKYPQRTRSEGPDLGLQSTAFGMIANTVRDAEHVERGQCLLRVAALISEDKSTICSASLHTTIALPNGTRID
ncbi:hypothetical protein NQZ68_008100 [Dissostichus eleginoides]|nr:hypothetical protein NQZ68_008100 [Dissostichus eleginoides]